MYFLNIYNCHEFNYIKNNYDGLYTFYLLIIKAKKKIFIPYYQLIRFFY